MPAKDVGGRDDGDADDPAGEGGGRRCCLLIGDEDRPGPRSRLSNPDSKVLLAAMMAPGFGVSESGRQELKISSRNTYSG